MIRALLREILAMKNSKLDPSNFIFNWKDSNSTEPIINTLRNYGGVCIKGIFNEEDIKDSFKIKWLYETYFSDKTVYIDVNKKRYEDLSGPFLRGQEISFTSNKLGKKKFISPDKGIVDIFKSELNISQLNIIKSLNLITFPIIQDAFPNLFKKGFSNLYLYKNVSTPRCFHRDGFLPRLKVFLILKGASNLDQGPYAFHPLSHKNKFFRFKLTSATNKIFGSDLGCSTSDSTFCSYKNLVPFFTNVGDVLITRQDCTHGDFPAKVPHKKAMVVINYF
tara:strand:+ start:653 stop:1486 length:834 start_codon:yes stop_codon:yes gene_type:complete